MPTLGSIVVNGKLAICTDKSVAELKNVDLPTLAFPNKPIINYNLFKQFLYLFSNKYVLN